MIAGSEVRDAFDFVFRKTRSGANFSPFACAIQAPAFDLTGQLRSAIEHAEGIDYDALEGYPLEPVIPGIPLSISGPSTVPSCPPFSPPAPDRITAQGVEAGASALPPPVAPIHSQRKGSIDMKVRKARGHAKRRTQRAAAVQAAPYGNYAVKSTTVRRVVRPSTPIKTTLETRKLRHTRNGYTAGRDSGAGKKVYRLNELVGERSIYGFELKAWDGKTSMPLVDGEGRIFAVCCGQPNDDSWQETHRRAASAIEDARSRLHVASKHEKHRRGEFPAFATGVSYGGGQKCPGNLINLVINAATFALLFQSNDFVRIAGFGSACFATWAPKLYGYYVDHLRPLYLRYPQLRRNFINSVFPCATINFGPTTCTYPHTDPGNLPFGWCAITALGLFDPKLGGHLVLWDLKLVIEFPPGATILIPSATIRHSNIAIRAGETRYSFTQYAAGGLFRWVDQNFLPTRVFRGGLSAEEKIEADLLDAGRWDMGVNLYANLESL